MKRLASFLFVLVVAAFVLMGLWAWLRSSGPTANELFVPPETNAYPALVAFSQQINGTPPSEDAAIGGLRKFVTANSNVLAGIRRQLPKPSAVPVQFSQR